MFWSSAGQSEDAHPPPPSPTLNTIFAFSHVTLLTYHEHKLPSWSCPSQCLASLAVSTTPSSKETKSSYQRYSSVLLYSRLPLIEPLQDFGTGITKDGNGRIYGISTWRARNEDQMADLSWGYELGDGEGRDTTERSDRSLLLCMSAYAM
ncbi:hypothetical protein N7G274_007485 [Stereocaulon virgatum]|uniref:Uncharacterized protein n=1 Tax=Stereocaulon virgatum TaxID=373712 RepID=A0ABR4A2U2_9LECA